MKRSRTDWQDRGKSGASFKLFWSMVIGFRAGGSDDNDGGFATTEG